MTLETQKEQAFIGYPTNRVFAVLDQPADLGDAFWAADSTPKSFPVMRVCAASMRAVNPS